MEVSSGAERMGPETVAMYKGIPKKSTLSSPQHIKPHFISLLKKKNFGGKVVCTGCWEKSIYLKGLMNTP